MAGNNFQAALYVAVLVGYYEEYFIKDSPFNDSFTKVWPECQMPSYASTAHG
jgi:hypothetical protein